MPKYSTNSNNRNSTDTKNCEMCGKETNNLERGEVAGAKLMLCDDCHPGKEEQENDHRESDSERTRRIIRETTENPEEKDRSWVEEKYKGNLLPHLIDNYDELVTETRESKDISQGELADMSQMDLQDLRAVENGKAISYGVDMEEVKYLEEVLEVTLFDESMQEERE